MIDSTLLRSCQGIGGTVLHYNAVLQSVVQSCLYSLQQCNATVHTSDCYCITNLVLEVSVGHQDIAALIGTLVYRSLHGLTRVLQSLGLRMMLTTLLKQCGEGA